VSLARSARERERERERGSLQKRRKGGEKMEKGFRFVLGCVGPWGRETEGEPGSERGCPVRTLHSPTFSFSFL
jgi:hypothetical protein